MTLGELVHAYREERGMSMQEFADRSNLSKAYISMLERNRNPQSGRPPVPSLETIRSVSHVIGADFNDVIAALDAEEPVSLSYLQSRRPFSDNLLPLEPMDRSPAAPPFWPNRTWRTTLTFLGTSGPTLLSLAAGTA